MIYREIRELIDTYPNVAIHSDTITDLTDLIRGTGYENRFIKIFSAQLGLLDGNGLRVIALKPKKFEKLKYVDNLYSMHVKCKSFNIRVLFSFTAHRSILLHGFYERSGKKSTDYSSAIVTAQQRKGGI